MNAVSSIATFNGYYGTARAALLDLLIDRQAPRHALEVGCGSGANLVELKRRHPAIHTTGVELNPDAARAASQPGRVDVLICADILDAAAVEFEPESFDLLIFSHVLEHFPQPEIVLDRCRSWLRSDGQVLIALPNIRHAVVIKQLLIDGKFDYQDAGILDRTHLRFFTRSSALRFIQAQGFDVLRTEADIEGRRSVWLDRLSLGVAREFAAFAYNFLAVKR